MQFTVGLPFVALSSVDLLRQLRPGCNLSGGGSCLKCTSVRPRTYGRAVLCEVLGDRASCDRCWPTGRCHVLINVGRGGGTAVRVHFGSPLNSRLIPELYPAVY